MVTCVFLSEISIEQSRDPHFLLIASMKECIANDMPTQNEMEYSNYSKEFLKLLVNER